MTEKEARKCIVDQLKVYRAQVKFKHFLTKNPALKESRIRKQLLKEIHDTEKEYVKSLKIIVEVFLNPIKKGKWLKPEQINIIFGKIETLYTMQASFLKEMDLEMGAPFPYQPKMGKVFSNWAPYLMTYPEYVNAYDDADKQLTGLLDANKKFQQFLDKQIQTNPECESLPLQGFLIKPVQRIPRYRMLLKDLIAKTPTDHVDAEGLNKAYSAIEDVALYVNEQKRDAENRKIFEILKVKFGASSYVLDTIVNKPQRKLKKNSNFKVQVKFEKGPNNVKKLQDISESFELYLFTDIILLLKKNSDNSAPVFYVFYLFFGTVVSDGQTMTVSTIYKGMKVDLTMTADNPNVDLVDQWKLTVQKHIDDTRNLFIKNSGIDPKEFAIVEETKIELMKELPDLTKKKNEQDEKHKKTKEEYEKARKEIAEDEAKVKELQERIKFNKARIEMMDGNAVMFEKKHKNLLEEYTTALQMNAKAEEEIFKVLGKDRDAFKDIFDIDPNSLKEFNDL